MEEHITVTKRKLANGLFDLNTAKNFESRPVLRSLNFTLMNTHLEYGCVLWGRAHNKDTQKRIVVQNKAVRIINHPKYKGPSNPLFKAQVTCIQIRLAKLCTKSN